jgi:hypothetical protein
MFAQRMGLPVERDLWVKAASEDPAATIALKTAISKFTDMVRMESSFQHDLEGVLGASLEEKSLSSEQRFALMFLQADTLRRLGSLAQAYDEFVALRKLMPELSARRDMVDYYISLLKDETAGKDPNKD